MSTLQAMTADQARAAFNAVKLPPAVVDYIKANPGMTALHLINIIILLTPGLIAAPALGALGFSAAGPVAGSIAAGFQSVHGTPLVFSGLQSAAMGGWGAGIVSGIVQGGAVASSSAAGAWTWVAGKAVPAKL